MLIAAGLALVDEVIERIFDVSFSRSMCLRLFERLDVSAVREIPRYVERPARSRFQGLAQTS